MFTWYRQAHLDPLSQDSLIINDAGFKPIDKFYGMGSIPFLLLPNGSQVVIDLDSVFYCNALGADYIDGEMSVYD
jgi:hypothetical protein